MVTIANIVEKHIRDSPFIQESLSRGLINHAALAEFLIPEIEKILKKKVKFSAANMAIRRYAEKSKKSEFTKIHFDMHACITLKSDLLCMTLKKTTDTEKKYLKIHEIIDYESGDFATITHGINEVMIITNAKYKRALEKIFPVNTIKKTIKDLSSISIILPEDATNQIGWFYLITREFAWENITIVDLVSTWTEMIIVVHEDDTAQAFDCLKKLMKKNK